MKSHWRNKGAHNGLWYEVTNDKGTVIEVATGDSASELVCILNQLEDKSAFGWQCIQDRYEGALVEQSVNDIKDWRIGLKCKPKYRNHEMFYEDAKIAAVLPSGTAGITDRNGVLVITVGKIGNILAAADEWVTS